jgi:hypothetical protein
MLSFPPLRSYIQRRYCLLYEKGMGHYGPMVLPWTFADVSVNERIIRGVRMGV